MNGRTRVVLVVVASAVVGGCPGARTGGGGPGGGGGGGGGGVNPDACGKLDGSKAERKLYGFLLASAELDRASIELETTIRNACSKMAVELGTSPDGDTRTVCGRAARELEANLKVSVKTEKRLVTRYTPPVCQTNVDVTADFMAQCEASVASDVDVQCSGTCGGTCSGACDGECVGGTGTAGTSGQCNGQCKGTCQGRCTGRCEGYVDVQGSAECEASAEVRASVKTECSEPKVEVVQQDVTIVDATKFNRALAAIDVGMPQILKASAKLELAGKALGKWVATGASLVAATGQLVADIGERGLCVGGQIAAAAAASANIEARFSLSIEVSAEVSASAGATAQ